MTRNDIVKSAIIGFVIALLLLSIGENIELAFPMKESLWITLAAFPLLAGLGMSVAGRLGSHIPVLFQAAKFLLVGALNTFVDLGVLNFLIATTGIASGIGYSIFKAVSFIVAVINSYFWNKYWTFQTKDASLQQTRNEFIQFFGVSVIGFFMNVGTASFVVNVIRPQFGLSENLWANIGALTATFVALSWNFLGYKFIVFKK